LPKPEKIESVAELKERIQDSTVVLLTTYVGIKAGQVTELRRRLREQQVELKVYKNTLASRALDELGLGDASKFMTGPTAWAFSKDIVAPSKIFRDFAKEVPIVAVSGGILEGRVVSKAQAEALAEMPSREVLLSQVVGTIAAPLRNFVGVVNALPRNLVNVLDQIRQQKEGSGAAA
jgi:large subunit ribosomal protein L10